MTIWIGEIQWMLRNGFGYARDPILKPLGNIETRDALIDWSKPEQPREADWPDAEVIIGNPPFLGRSLLRQGLGSEYVDVLFALYEGRVPGEADFVIYWHEKARAMIEAGATRRAGLLAPQSVRSGANRRVIERIKRTGGLFSARSDEPWVLAGASVHISFLGYDDGSDRDCVLDDQRVAHINPNLTAGIDLTRARRLTENLGMAFQGPVKVGPFDISHELAAEMLKARNADGRSNGDVIRPWANGLDIMRRPRGMWIIDFGVGMPREEAALYQAPFEHVSRFVRPMREAGRRARRAELWWLHGETVPGLRAALKGLPRYVATTRLSPHRLFVWLSSEVLADSRLIVFSRSDDYFFGILHSRVHEVWSRRTAGAQRREAVSGFTYTPTTSFETFPFPRPTAGQCKLIAASALRLDQLRRGWLDPPGMPEEELKVRTLTNLSNERPTWLRDIHARLDQAVLAAYGWPADVADEDLLARLLALNLDRTGASAL